MQSETQIASSSIWTQTVNFISYNITKQRYTKRVPYLT